MENPWRYDINKNYLFSIIASYLSDDIKEFIIIAQETVHLPSVYNKSLLFDYLSSIDTEIINSIVSTGSLADLFMKKCPEFKYLDYYGVNDGYFENFDENTLIPIRKIHENCPLIEYLSIIFSPSKEHFNEFEKLLKVCQNLKSLILIIYNAACNDETYEKITKYGKQLLDTLMRSAPTKLREIRFFNNFRLQNLIIVYNYINVKELLKVPIKSTLTTDNKISIFMIIGNGSKDHC
ncbi:hypothetical protein RCL_jg4828.t1 [Rhizophagus clarus]|uniref:Uncharacterized protein n=1 Tax=Rhizophagus clarus TaxID=94130 RepID=A0A8H3MCW5_9GLOM|nr:hypothetical protein RCL_jg4828.t1 [Rhizophagus clarus]